MFSSTPSGADGELVKREVLITLPKNAPSDSEMADIRERISERSFFMDLKATTREFIMLLALSYPFFNRPPLVLI